MGARDGVGQMAPAGAISPAAGVGFGGAAYRTYVLLALLLVYTFNFIDRILIGVVAEPIIREFELLDWQFGLLSGFGFALFYTLMGIPIARIAETRDRVTIIAICVALWSLMTALCGLAGSFVMLLIFRIGVGVGEAGCTPSASSLIADYFAPKARARALGVYAMGVTLGTVLANLFGGPVAQALSWREAFIYLGAPGLLLALVIKLSIKEPPRGYTDPTDMPKVEKTGFIDAMRELASKPTYWTMTAGATLAAFVGYGLSNFTSSFLVRNHGLTVGEAAVQFNAPIALASALGTLLMGILIERLTPRYPNAVAWLPGLGLALAVPFAVIGYNADNLTVVLVCLCLGGLFKYGYLTSQYAIGQAVVGLRTRATAIAVLLFVINLIGYGLGPLFVGTASDVFISMRLSSADIDAGLTLVQCKGDLALLTEAQAVVCSEANGWGLRYAITVTAVMSLLAALCFYLSARTLQRDLVSR